MKLGDVGEEMVATAIALAKERRASIDALYVMKIGLEHTLDAELAELEAAAEESLGGGAGARQGERHPGQPGQGPGPVDR